MLDVPGELAQYLLPEPEPSTGGGGGAGDDVSRWIPPADANKWHRVTVVGRPRVSSGTRPGVRGEARWEGQEEGWGGQQHQHQYQRQNVSGEKSKELIVAEQGGGENGDGAARARRRSVLESSPSAFVVMFESGRTTTLDLSDFSIKWIGFCGECEEVSVEVGKNRGRPGSDREAREQARMPPGFRIGDRGGLPPPGGVLANDRTDVGTRVDVWWPRYNSYFRAAVRFFSGELAM